MSGKQSGKVRVSIPSLIPRVKELLAARGTRIDIDDLVVVLKQKYRYASPIGHDLNAHAFIHTLSHHVIQGIPA